MSVSVDEIMRTGLTLEGKATAQTQTSAQTPTQATAQTPTPTQASAQTPTQTSAQATSDSLESLKGTDEGLESEPALNEQLASSQVFVIVPAAGSGSRMAADRNKQLLEIAGQTVLGRTLKTLSTHPAIDRIVLVARAEELDEFQALIETEGITKIIAVVEGGRDRQASVYEGLKALDRQVGIDDQALLLIHDGARCLLKHELIDRILEGLRQAPAVTAALPVVDTLAAIKLENSQDGCDLDENNLYFIDSVPDRRQFWRIQTPQGFRLRDIIGWHAAWADQTKRFTDDSSIALAAGAKVGLVQGSDMNIKITTAFDLKLAEAYLSEG